MNTNTEISEVVHHSWVSELNDSIQELIQEKTRNKHARRPGIYNGLYMAIEAGIDVPLLIRCGEHEIHSIRTSIWTRLGRGVVRTKTIRNGEITMLNITPNAEVR